ncbi:MAG: nuclear transport factor 2 family protein [Myxococcota bacterium]
MYIFLMSLMSVGTSWAGRGDKAAVTETLELWTQATDARDADAVAALFRPDAVQAITMGDKAMSLPTDVYVQMIRDGKVGGDDTELDVHAVSVHGALATALTTRTTKALTMHTAVVLERDGDRWLVVSATVKAESKP